MPDLPTRAWGQHRGAFEQLNLIGKLAIFLCNEAGSLFDGTLSFAVKALPLPSPWQSLLGKGAGALERRVSLP